MNAVYAFCRKTDDIVDDNSKSIEHKSEMLSEWKLELQKSFSGKSHNPLLVELNKYVKMFKIPHEPFMQLIEGVEIDLNKNRFANFDELKNYCYKVASTVGLMTIPILGYKNPKTEKFAIDLGIALQLTNILRDVKVDAKSNRIYIPEEDLVKFNYLENELLKNTYNENFKELMKFQVKRAREFYKSADLALSAKDKSSMFTAKAMEYIYLRLLDKIEQEKYKVFRKKVRVSDFNKLIITLGVFLKYKFYYKWISA